MKDFPLHETNCGSSQAYLTIWNPSDDILSQLKESKRYRFYDIGMSTRKPNDKLPSLIMNSRSRVKSVETVNDQDCILYQDCRYVSMISDLPRDECIDIIICVAGTSKGTTQLSIRRRRKKEQFLPSVSDWF